MCSLVVEKGDYIPQTREDQNTNPPTHTTEILKGRHVPYRTVPYRTVPYRSVMCRTVLVSLIATVY